MGKLAVNCVIKNHADREKLVKIPRLQVDTGSDATWIPRKLLEQIEIKAEKSWPYPMANGQYAYRNVGYAIIRVGQRETADEVVFAEKGDRKVLGPRALTGLRLWVDSTNKKLIQNSRSCVAQVSKPAVPLTSKSAPLRSGQQVWKPPTQQTWKSALQTVTERARPRAQQLSNRRRCLDLPDASGGRARSKQRHK